MARKADKKEIEVEVPHVWRKVTGKYHRKGYTPICPGDTFIAEEDTFKDDPTWQYVGPVE